VAMHGGSVEGLVPDAVLGRLQAKLEGGADPGGGSGLSGGPH
jgi:hypothetical protein